MASRVSSTVTKPIRRKANPRPRKYASASERQAAYRERAPEVCFRAEPGTVETLDRIADTLDQSRADVLLSMTKFALANHDWARFGLTHKPLPFGYGVNPVKPKLKAYEGSYAVVSIATGQAVAELPKDSKLLDKINTDKYRLVPIAEYLSGITRKANPVKTSTKKPTPAQIAARERFAEMARSGGFKKTGGRKANPAPLKMKIRGSETPDNPEGLVVTEAGALRWAKQNMPSDLKRAGFVPSVVAGARGWSINYGASVPGHSSYARSANPTKRKPTVSRNPSTWGTAPLKKVRSVIARSKTTGERRTFMMADSSGVKVPTPYDFGFRLEIEGEMFDFVGRYEGPLLIISEKSTGLRLPGDVGFTLRSSYGDDKNAAKRWTLDLIERVTPQKFAQKVRSAR